MSDEGSMKSEQIRDLDPGKINSGNSGQALITDSNGNTTWGNSNVPSGGIIMWSGSSGNIPAGYTLCDGSNGAPDLRNRFVVGSGGNYSDGQTGGSTSHSHGGDGTLHDEGSGVTLDGQDAQNHLPPYYAVAFIMKT